MQHHNRYVNHSLVAYIKQMSPREFVSCVDTSYQTVSAIKRSLIERTRIQHIIWIVGIWHCTTTVTSMINSPRNDLDHCLVHDFFHHLWFVNGDISAPRFAQGTFLEGSPLHLAQSAPGSEMWNFDVRSALPRSVAEVVSLALVLEFVCACVSPSGRNHRRLSFLRTLVNSF